MQLTPHFCLDEFTASATAEALGIDNTPKQKAILDNLGLLALALEQIRFGIGRPISISSGYRCPRLNIAVKGSKTSAHVDGLAADISAAGLTSIDLCRYIEANIIGFDQCIQEVDLSKSRRWCHFGIKAPGAKVRQESKTIVIHPNGSKTTHPGIIEVA